MCFVDSINVSTNILPGLEATLYIFKWGKQADIKSESNLLTTIPKHHHKNKSKSGSNIEMATSKWSERERVDIKYFHTTTFGISRQWFPVQQDDRPKWPNHFPVQFISKVLT